MNQEFLILLLIVITGFGIIIFLLNKKLSNKKNEPDQAMVEWLKSMQTSLDNTNKNLTEQLNRTNLDMNRTLRDNAKQLNTRLDNAARVIGEVSNELGQMSEIGRNMRDLQDYLKNPKLRGNIGEQVLNDLIAQMFPKNSYVLQYQFKSGSTVDAAIITDAGILTIDAKFPMENFQKLTQDISEEEKKSYQKLFIKDVKKHISDISEKYIVPDENTMDFSLMYLPSESIYYEVVNTMEIMNFAKKMRVYPVSPSTLYAHLQTILLSFEGKKIEKKAREVFRYLQALSIEHEKIMENLTVLGKHMKNSDQQFNRLSSSFQKFGNKIKQIEQIEPDKIDSNNQ